MSTSKLPIAAALAALALLASSVSRADQLLLTSGESLEGDLQPGRLPFDTDRGRLEIPLDNVTRVDLAADGTATIHLVDGTVLGGRLAVSELQLDQGLFERVVPIGELSGIVPSAPSVTLPAGTSVLLQVAAFTPHDRRAPGSGLVMCTAIPVSVDGQIVIEQNAPAAATGLGAVGGRGLESIGTVSLGGGTVAAIDGMAIPLAAPATVQGQLNAEKRPGGPAGAAAAAGVVLQATTTEAVEISTRATVASSAYAEAKARCEDHNRFRGREVIPVDEASPSGTYAPVPQPMRLSFPIDSLLNRLGSKRNRFSSRASARQLTMDSVSIPSLVLHVNGKRPGPVTLQTETMLFVGPSHDRLITLRYDVIADGRTLATVVEREIEVEEAKTKTNRARIELSERAVDALLAAEDPRLQISLSAVDD